jgi:hypothetical protein
MSLSLPNTVETCILKARYDLQRRQQQSALRRMVADFDLMPFDLDKANSNTLLWSDGQGRYYEVEDIALTVLNCYIRMLSA